MNFDGLPWFGVLLVAFGLAPGLRAAGVDDSALRKAVTFYASFDETPEADFGGGALTLSTRFNHPTAKGAFVYEKGFDPKVFRILRRQGVHGGALECLDVLPRNGRIFFPARGNLAFQKGGWRGALSLWINTDPNTRLKTPFCDPVQITQKGANNGGLWIDFNNAKPRALRHGAFPALAAGQTAFQESDPQAPMVRVPHVAFKAGEWHHVAVTWDHFDTGKPDGSSSLFLDGKLVGSVRDRPLAMDWDLDKTGIYVGVGYIGLLDEFALFRRPLTAGEVARLHDEPGLLASLKGQKKSPSAP